MPASTVLSQYTFSNLGPLTTTYTAPPACMTPTEIGLAYSFNPEAAYYVSTCSTFSPVSDCVPSGKVIDEDRKQHSTAYYAHYYSPGLVCPASWTTAGIAARIDSTSVSSTGYFAPVNWGTGAPLFNPAWNVFMQNLDLGETVAVCCPSGYTAGPVGGACHTNLPTSLYTATTGCQLRGGGGGDPVAFTFNGTTATGRQVTPGAPLSTTTMTVGPDELSSMTGVAYLPAVTLVYRQEHAEATATGPPKATNAAGGLKITRGDGTVGTMVIVWGAAALLGAILFGAA